jgi:hypothetical protein
MNKPAKETPQMPLRDPYQAETGQTQDCDLRWEKSLQLWTRSNSLVREIIAHAKRGDKGNFQVAGIVMQSLSSDLQSLASKKQNCKYSQARLRNQNEENEEPSMKFTKLKCREIKTALLTATSIKYKTK